MDTVLCMPLYLQTGKVMAWDFFPLNSFFSTRASISSCLASKRFFPLKGKKNGIRSFKRLSIALRNNNELHHFKTTDSRNEWHWPYCHSKIFCWETVDPGSHGDNTWHKQYTKMIIHILYWEPQWHWSPSWRMCAKPRNPNHCALGMRGFILS